jgi:hypothetical protein
MAKLRTESIPEERGGKTDSRGKLRRGPENRRFAGAIMNIDLSAGTPTQPYDTAQSLAPGQEGLVGKMYSQAPGRIGQRVVGSTGLQEAFAPTFIGAAERRQP